MIGEKKVQKYLQNLLFTGVSFISVLGFIVFPLCFAIVVSFKSGRGAELTFDGFNNYRKVVSDEYARNAIANNILCVLIIAPIVLVLAIFIANEINSIRSSKLKSFFSCILLFPSITSPVAYSYFFKKAYLNVGVVCANTENLLLTENGARIAIALVCIWAWTGFYSLLFLSAFQNIDPILYKASRIDGANRLQSFVFVSLPSIKNTTVFSMIMLVGSSFQLFAEVSIISKGGPNGATITLSYYIYRLCFEYIPQFGYASAIGIVIFIVSLIFSWILLRLGGNKHAKK